MIDAYEIPCRELVELLTDYLEGALDPTDVERVDAHLAVCPPCLHVLEQFRRTVALGRAVGDEAVEALDPHVRTELLQAFASIRRDDG